jgi:hypothetical protein
MIIRPVRNCKEYTLMVCVPRIGVLISTLIKRDTPNWDYIVLVWPLLQSLRVWKMKRQMIFHYLLHDIWCISLVKLYIIHGVCGVGINMTGHQAWWLINLVCNELTVVLKELQITNCCQSQLNINYCLNDTTELEKFPYMCTVFYCFLIYLCLGSKVYTQYSQ